MTDKKKGLGDMTMSELVDEFDVHMLRLDVIRCELKERIG